MKKDACWTACVRDCVCVRVCVCGGVRAPPCSLAAVSVPL